MDEERKRVLCFVSEELKEELSEREQMERLSRSFCFPRVPQVLALVLRCAALLVLAAPGLDSASLRYALNNGRAIQGQTAPDERAAQCSTRLSTSDRSDASLIRS